MRLELFFTQCRAVLGLGVWGGVKSYTSHDIEGDCAGRLIGTRTSLIWALRLTRRCSWITSPLVAQPLVLLRKCNDAPLDATERSFILRRQNVL